MKRLLTSAVAAAAMLTAMGNEAEAQDLSASRFGLGVYAGGAYTSSWYTGPAIEVNEDDEDEGYGFGLSSAFGGMAQYFFHPNFGVRVHYGYLPTELPTADGEFDDGLPLNNHFYDLDVVFRAPSLPLVSSVIGNAYGFVGAGGLTADVASGEIDEGCEPGALARGVCFPLNSDYGTVGQGTIGIGGDIVSLANNIGGFVELGAHIYDSPVHELNDSGDQDEYAVTTRLVAGVKLAFGEFFAPPPPVELPPPPPPVDLPPPLPVTQPIRVCVVQGGAVTEVDAMFNPATGDTVVMQAGAEQPFSVAYPATGAEYASGQPFFINNEEITVMDTRYVRFGLPRVVTPTDVARVGDFQGVGVFAEAGAATPPQVIYLPVRPGCEFQPYQQAEVVGGVRG